MNLPTPQQFATLLHQSLLPDYAKEIVLEKLPNLDNEQILAIYEKLQEEQDQIKKAKAKFESKINFNELKFEQELEKLKEKRQ